MARTDAQFQAYSQNLFGDPNRANPYHYGPVSYTHLDVYKRQRHRRVGGQEGQQPAGRQHGGRGRERAGGAGQRQAGALGQAGQTQDVYKRQVLDPARQAQQGLDALQNRRGAANAGDFLPLARAAAQTRPFAADNVARLSYADQALTLQLADAGAQAQRVAETPALIQQAASQGLKLERGDTDNTWRITRSQP